MELMGRTIAVPSVISRESAPAFAQDIARALADDEVRVLTLEGTPGEFCRGMDITALDRAEAGATARSIRAFADALSLLAHARKPAVAVGRGAALGGGLGIAAACDVVLASRSATFALPEGLFGLAPAVIAPVLLGRITSARLRRLALTAESIDAAEAKTIGLVDEVLE